MPSYRGEGLAVTCLTTQVPFLLNAVLKQVQALESMPSSQSSHPQQYQQEYQQEYSGAVQAEMGQDQTHGGLSVQQAMGEQPQHGHEQRQEYGQAKYYGQQGQQGQQGVNHPGARSRAWQGGGQGLWGRGGGARGREGIRVRGE